MRRTVYTVLELVILVACFINFYGTGCSKRDFILVIAMAILITTTFIGESFLTQLFNNSFSKQLGAISYAMYCNHMIVNILIRAYFPGYSFWKMIIVYLLLVVVLSIITDKICTKIIQSKKIIGVKR